MSTPSLFPSHPRGTSEADDLLVMARLRGGEAAALDELMRRYWSPLVAYVTDMLGNGDAAKDAVQDLFVRVWELRASWTPTGSVRGYLYRMARNRAIDELRRQRVRRVTMKIFARQPPTPAEELAERELQTVVERAIAALPLRRREVFVLGYTHQLTHRQIAEVMDTSVQTVANQMSAALSDLRLTLRQHLPVAPDSR